MKSFLWVFFAATTIYSFPLYAEETVRLSDGRTLILSDDGTYSWPKSERYISITLTSTGKPSGFMSDDRDCSLNFDVTNELGGTLIGMSANLEIIDSTGAKLLREGIMNYDIDMFNWSEVNLQSGSTSTQAVDVQASCESIARVLLGDIGEKYCNYVGRLPMDRCRELVRVESEVSNIVFTK